MNVHPIDVHVGLRVRNLRLDLGLTQADLAGHLGIRFQQIQKYETGRNRISASRLWDIAQALRTDVGYFFEEVDIESNPDIGALMRA